MTLPLDELGRTWDLVDEEARPGYYAATLRDDADPGSGDAGIRAEITVGPKSAVHRYTFPRHRNARIVIDFSLGGLSIPFGSTIPLRAHLQSIAPGVAQGEIVVEGAPLAVHVECDAPHWRQMLWYDRRLMPGGTRLDFDHIRPTTLRSFGLMWAGPAEPGQTIELRFGFSLRGVEQARANLVADCGVGPGPVRPAPRPHREDVEEAPAGDPRRHPVEGPADRVLDRALPLAHQAVPRTRRESVLADRRAVRVRPLDDVGHLPHPAAAADDARARSRRRACERPAHDLRGGGQLPDRVSHGARQRPLLAAGQRARADVPRRPLPARRRGHRLGLGARAHAQRPAAHVRRGLPAARRGASDQPHARRRVRLLVHGEGRAPRRRPCSRRGVRGAGGAVGERVRRVIRAAQGLDVLRGRQMELLVPAAARHGRSHRARGRRRRLRRTARPLLRVRRATRATSPACDRMPRRWPRATPSAASRD